MYIRFPLSLRKVEDLLHERGIGISHETIRYWWNRFGPLIAREIKKRRFQQLRQVTQWRWHPDEVSLRTNGETHYLWRAVNHKGEVLGSFATKTRDKAAALIFQKKTMKRYGRPEEVVTDRLRSHGAAMREIGKADLQASGGHKKNRAENSHLPFRRRERVMARFRQMRNLQKFAAAPSSADPASRRSEMKRSPNGVGFWLHKAVRPDFRDWSAFV